MAADTVVKDPAPPAAKDPEPAPVRASTAGVGRRLSIFTSVVLQIVALLAIVVMVNVYSFKHFHRFDYSRDRRTALSERTKDFLKSINKPVRMIVLYGGRSAVNPEVNLAPDVGAVATEYRDVQPKFINLDIIDSYRDFTRAKEVQDKYKLGTQDNVIILDCEGRTKVLGEDKIVQWGQPDMPGMGPRVTALTAEQNITSALIEVSEGKTSRVYYVSGHGELTPQDGQGMELAGEFLKAEHLDTAEINLQNVQAVPADASMVMLSGARFDLTEREVKLLSDYWDKGGRLLVLLNPDAASPHLDTLLARVGIKPDDNRVLQAMMLQPGLLGVMREVSARFVGTTVITKKLASMAVILPGGTQSLSLTPEAGAATSTHVQPLLLASEGYWGETDYKDLENTEVSNDPGKDKQAPLYVAATVEKGAVGDERVQTNASRMVVVGNSHLAENVALEKSDRLQYFFVSATNWLLEREALVGIPPKEISNAAYDLPDTVLPQLFWILILAIPGVCALCGIIVWWWRRRA